LNISVRLYISQVLASYRLIPEGHEKRTEIVQLLKTLEVHSTDFVQQRWFVVADGKKTYGRPSEGTIVKSTTNGKLRFYLLKEQLRSSHYSFSFDLAELLSGVCAVEDQHRTLMHSVMNVEDLDFLRCLFQKKGIRKLTENEENQRPALFRDSETKNIRKIDPSVSTKRVKQLAEGHYSGKKVRIFSGNGRRLKKSEATKKGSTVKLATGKTATQASQKSDNHTGSEEIENWFLASDYSTDPDSGPEVDNSEGELVEVVKITRGKRRVRKKLRPKGMEIDEEVATAAELFVSGRCHPCRIARILY